jgi:D-glycero-D-manno-heptose 1,7-bisphosphate phosphatase
MQLVILDRDGVINEVPDDCIRSPGEWRPIRGSLEAIARLNRAGWRVVVAMNQPELATGQYDLDMLARINETMQRSVKASGGVIDAVFFCPHAAADKCNCHKPAPGLLLDITQRLHIKPGAVPVIGDSISDIQAAQAAGALPMLVKTGKGFGTASLPELDPAVPVFDDLYSAVESLLAGPGT